MEANALAPHVLRLLANYQMKGRRANLQTLVDDLRVRRADIRSTVSVLDAEGYLDALRMSLTMRGFAIGTGLVEADLPPLRRESTALTLVAA